MFILGGLVAIGTGLFDLTTGIDGLPGESAASGTAESEFRFLNVFWIGYGAALLRVAPRAALETWAVRTLMALLFAAGLARVLAWVAVGRPDDLFVALMVIELVVPPLVVLWQARLARSADAV
jgi:Domain of unknown function (DUF4345)